AEVALVLVGDRLADRLELVRTRHRHLAAARHDDRLEVLAAVHGAESLSPERVIAVVHHRGDALLLLAGRADRRHADIALAAELLLERVERLGHFLAPQLTGGLERDVALADHEQRRRRRLAADHERVVTGRAQVTAHAAARARIAPRAGQRRLADDLDAAR